MKKLSRIIIALIACTWLANFSDSSSNEGGREKHKVNFYGTLTDNQGSIYKVENISIGGLYKQIPVYQKPTDADINPDINKSRIDLSEVYAIQLTKSGPSVSRFDSRDYIEIVVISNDKQHTEYSYIIELSRKIYCDQKNDAGPIERELSFQALEELSIEGYKHREPNDQCSHGE